MPPPSFLEELRSYVGFTDEDARLLAGFSPLAAPFFAAVADEFYALIRMHEGSLAVLRDEEQARRLHASLQVWLGELLSGPYDEAYVQRHGRIGQVHVRVGLPQHYMVTAMSRVRASLCAVSDRVLSDDPARAAGCGQAIARVCDIDLAIMLDSYRRDLDARMERVRALELESANASNDEPRRVLAEVFDLAEVAILCLVPDGVVARWNRKAEALTGYASDEIVGTDPFGRLFGERADAVRARLLSARPAAPVELDEGMVTRSGRPLRVRWHASAGTREMGRESMVVVVVVAVDLTDEREGERRSRQVDQLAATGRLAAALAHEIRNPLNGASLHLSVLERALSSGAWSPSPGPDETGRASEARVAVDVLRVELRRLSDLVTGFLDVSRPRRLVLREENLNPIAHAVGLLLAPEAAARGITLRVEGFPLPALGTFDCDRMKQVLLNLGRNALEAVDDGGLVVVRVRRTARALEIDVEDNGRGIADPKAPVFDAFYTTKNGGAGLGLSAVQSIVLDHGGDVQFKSQPGNTLFSVRLPLA